MTVRRPPQPRSNHSSGQRLTHSEGQKSSQTVEHNPRGQRAARSAGRNSKSQADEQNPKQKRGHTLDRGEHRVDQDAHMVDRGARSARRVDRGGAHAAKPKLKTVQRASEQHAHRPSSKPNTSESAALRHAPTPRNQNPLDVTFAWEGEKKSHQLSMRAVAILGFAALGVLIVINPLRAFIAQQEQIRELNAQVQASKDHIEELEQSIALWNDPAYVQAQARERLGYVMPGQTLYVVTGGDADPHKRAQEKVDKANEARRAITPFYMTMWDSITVAGQAAGSENPQNVPVIEGDLAGENPDEVPSEKPDGSKADNLEDEPADAPANNGEE